MDADRYVIAENLSEGWLKTVLAIRNEPGDHAVHFITRVVDPTAEVPAIREGAQWLIDQVNAGEDDDRDGSMWDIETTRNTIFPASWAERMPKPEDLAAHYREHYSSLREYNGNGKGTYFGRVVAYPRGEKKAPGDQLSELVRKLRVELKGGAAKGSRYEVNIYNELEDTGATSFPCMAHLSFHCYGGQLHAQVIYRNEYLIARGYGNFLGIAQLQAYIAHATKLSVGELIVTMGHVKLDRPKREIDAMLTQFDLG